MTRFVSSAINLLLVLVLGVSLSGCVTTRLPVASTSPWQALNLDTEANPLDVAFTDANHGFLVGSNRMILETNDGGSSWSERSLDLPEEENFRLISIDFDGDDGWIAGQPGLLMHTTDGGNNWTRLFLDTKLPGEPYLITALGRNSAELATNVGAVYRTSDGGGSWDVVIGHSIGAASAVVSAHDEPAWTKRLILLDPALELGDATREQVLENQRQGHLHQGVDEIRGANPHWHPLDVEIKVQAHRQASLFALEHAVFDNDPWNVTREATTLSVPTHVIGADPAQGSMFCNDYAKRIVEANNEMTYEVIEGAGHSVHRDKPQETIEAILRFLG